jgi:8-oxo-dGTP pyrophosphatase MutT (NUDIX family)
VSIANPSGRPPVVQAVAGFDARIVPGGGWPWAEANAGAIRRHWSAAVASNPALYDGRVLIAVRAEMRDGVLCSDHTEIPFSALHYWRSLSFPDADAFNLFGAAVVVTADRGVLLGRMGPGTANASFVYFPAGTPDRDDIVGDRLDVEGSILRELREETGLGADDLIASGERWAVRDAGILCCARRYDTPLTASEVEARVAAHIAADPHHELDLAIVVRRACEPVPGTLTAYARALIAQVIG